RGDRRLRRVFVPRRHGPAPHLRRVLDRAHAAPAARPRPAATAPGDLPTQVPRDTGGALMRSPAETERLARELDRADPLAPFRERFHVQPGRIYLDGNSLGLL